MSEDIRCAGVEGGPGDGGLGDAPVPSSMPGSPPQMRRWADTKAWRCSCSVPSSERSMWALPWTRVSGSMAGTGMCLLLACTPLPVGINPQAPAPGMASRDPPGDSFPQAVTHTVPAWRGNAARAEQRGGHHGTPVPC